MSADAQAAPVTANGAPAVVEKPQETPTPGFKVFAGNLSYTTTDDGLKAFFAPVENDILSAQVIMRGTRSAGYGFVALASLEAAEKAVEALNKQDLDGRAVIIEIAKPADQKDQEKKERRFSKRRPGRRGAKAVPGEVTEAEADGETPKTEGESTAEAPKPKKKKSSRKKRAAATPAEGEAGAEASAGAAETADAPTKKAPRPRKPRAPRPPRPAGEDPAGEPSKTTLFVANLGFSVDDDGLKALFTEAGIDVTSARIVLRRWPPRKSKGYGFVDVGSEENQKKAIDALDGAEVAGRAIAVKIAVNTPTPRDEEEKLVDAAAEVPLPDPAPAATGF